MVKNLPASAGDAEDMGSVPWLGRSPGGGNGNALQCSCLGNPMDRGFWRVTGPQGCRVRHDLATNIFFEGSQICGFGGAITKPQ